MVPVKLQLFLVCAALISVAVCSDTSFVQIPTWSATIGHPKQRSDGKLHTLDVLTGPAEGCTPLPMGDDQRMAVVNSHNELRRKVAKGLEEGGQPGPQPSANYMLEMEYDLDLERVAMAWVSQCKFEHDDLRDIDGYYSVGQNIRRVISSKPLEVEDWWKGHALSWYSEVNDFNKDLVANFTKQPAVKIGHYAQIVHDLANRIGCAESLSRTPDDKQRNIRIAVCNYGNGVLPKRPVYEAGVPCEGVDEEHCNDGLVINKNIGALAAVRPIDASFVNIIEWKKKIGHTEEKNHDTHTLDLYPGPAAGCRPHKMAEKDRNSVVQIHNNLRRIVASGKEDPNGRKVADMMKMKYSEDLERVAMVWVSQCTLGHDNYRDIEPFSSVGQNVVMAQSTMPLEDIDWAQIVRHWYEKKSIPDNSILANSKAREHSQVVYSNAESVGCAYATNLDLTSPTPMFTRFAACNYGEGVIFGSPLFSEGEPCSGVDKEQCDDGLVISKGGGVAAVTPSVTSFVNIIEWRNTIPHVTEKKGHPHTLDLNDGPAEGCTPREMTAEERILVTKLHNDKRRQVAKGTEIRGNPGPQPPASNMIRLEYDEDLEHVAMAWISQCQLRRDKYRDIEPFHSVGQIFLINGRSHPFMETEWEKIINFWYDQVANFNGMVAIAPQEDPGALLKGDTGDYAQMVQANAYRVGCAVATTFDSTALKHKRVIACNYGRLHTDSRLYKPGQPCSGMNEKCDDGLITLGRVQAKAKL